MSGRNTRGDPCLCGDRKTWHKECYRAESEKHYKNDPIFRLGHAAGFRAGQEAMRERAAAICDGYAQTAIVSSDAELAAKNIRALPIVEPDADK